MSINSPEPNGAWLRFGVATALAAAVSLAFVWVVLKAPFGGDPAGAAVTGPVEGATVVSACTPPRGSSIDGGNATIDVAGLPRTYRLHLPDGYTGATPVPVVFLFHGTSGTIDGIEEYTRFPDAATERGYLVVTPQGLGDPDKGDPEHWNIPGFETKGDDVAFVNAIVDKLRGAYCIDTSRVFATGLSAGAAFSTYLACQSDVVVAIAPVAGINLVRPCLSGPPVSVLAIHGTADPFVPYPGLSPEVAAISGDFYEAPVTEAVSSWATRANCGRTEDAGLTTDVRSTAYVGCVGGSAVVLYTVEGGGHTWPGAPPRDGATGPTTQTIDANKVILDFFDLHSRAPVG